MSRGRGSQHEVSMGFQDHLAKAQEMMTQRCVVVNTSQCQLPGLNEFFNSPEWDLPDLIQSRDGVNNAKNRLNTWDRREWEKAAAAANRADFVRQRIRDEYHVEMGTIAWAKMYETIVSCDMLPLDSPALVHRERGKPGVVSVHLCEAPGAFIAATNHYVKTHRTNWRWDWMAVSLNPYFEGNDQFAMIDDDALIAATQPHWCFGADNSGDIRRPDNIRNIWQRAQEMCSRMGCRGAMMVTADGAVDTSADPNRQEYITASLHYCEVVAALGVLAVGGNFVWKGFTLYEHPSICSLYLMGCVFEQVLVYKPATSKPANSEVYVVGKGFRGIPEDVLEVLLEHCGEDVFTDRALFALSMLPKDFLQTARHAAKFFGDTTAEAISEAISLHGLPHQALSNLRRAKDIFAQQWCEQLQLRPLDRSQFLAPDSTLDGRRNNTSLGKRKELTGTLEDRQEQKKKWKQDLGQESGPAAVGKRRAPDGGEEQLGKRQRPGLGGMEGGGGEDDAGGMQVSHKAMGMMAKMGYKEGQGLGRERQGMAAALEVAGNQRRAGLGMGMGAASGQATSAAAAVDWAPVPDTAMLGSPGPLTEEEVQSWPTFTNPVMPVRVTTSKICHDVTILASLRTSRTACRDAATAAGTDPVAGVCRHAAPCAAPRRLHHRSRAYWKLAALDNALNLCDAASSAAQASDSVPHALDLSFRGSGASEFLAGASHGWRLTLLDTADARAFAAEDEQQRVALQPLHSGSSAPASEADCMRLCTSESSQQLAGSVPGCGLVVGDLGSLRRAGGSSGAHLGVLEGEYSPHYRRRLLWEVATALGCLALGGCAVLRLGDCLTMFSTSVLYLLHRSFQHLCLVKPFASCVCSGEQFVVAMGYLDAEGVACRHMLTALQELQTVEGGGGGAAGAGEEVAVQPGVSRVLGEVVPAGTLVKAKEFYEYVARRTCALAKRQADCCSTVLRLQQEGAMGQPTEQEREAVAAQAERLLAGGMVVEARNGAAPSAAVHDGSDGARSDPFDELQRKYGGMFTRGGGIGSSQTSDGPSGAAGLGSRMQVHMPPGRGGQAGQAWQPQHATGLGFSNGAGKQIRLLARSHKGEEFVCHVVCRGLLTEPAAKALAGSDQFNVIGYRYRDDFEPHRHYHARLVLLPAGPDDGPKLSSMMAFLANTQGQREKVAVVAPAGTEQRRQMGACLVARDALDPAVDGLQLWFG